MNKGACPNLLAEAALYRFGDETTQFHGGELSASEGPGGAPRWRSSLALGLG